MSKERQSRVVPNEFHKDEAAQTGQRSGAVAEEEEITCNERCALLQYYYYPVPVPLVSIIVLCVFCPTGVYNQPSSPLSLSNPLVGEIGKG